MRLHIFASLVLLTLLVCDGLADKPKKYKKVRRAKKFPIASAEIASELNESVGEDVIKMLESDEQADDKTIDNEVVPPEDNDIEEPIPLPDPCASVHCGAGRTCEVDESDEPQCVCISNCPEETDPRRKVCSNHNETWTSDCAIYQHRCWCDVKDARCKGERFRHVHIEYYGECREMPECTKDEMADFPRRMRDWLFNIMRDLADRRELPKHFIKMEREAENNYTRRWTNAAIWKWCDLDGHPHDRTVSRHELFPIRAPLMALEHCIAPFLNSCDANDDHRITLQEWADCLNLEEYDIEMKCEDIEKRYEEDE